MARDSVFCAPVSRGVVRVRVGQRHEADPHRQVQRGGDAAEHRHRVAFVFRVFEVGDYRLGRADALGELRLGQPRRLAGVVYLLAERHRLFQILDPGAACGVVAERLVHDRDGVFGLVGLLFGHRHALYFTQTDRRVEEI